MTKDFDPDAWAERAALMEYDGGLSRFDAETQAARAQGVDRWEAIGNVARRVAQQTQHRRAALAGGPRADDVPAVQPDAEEEARPVFKRQPNR